MSSSLQLLIESDLNHSFRFGHSMRPIPESKVGSLKKMICQKYVINMLKPTEIFRGSNLSLPGSPGVLPEATAEIGYVEGFAIGDESARVLRRYTDLSTCQKYTVRTRVY